MPDNTALPPPVSWAQRKNVIFLTFCVEDCKSPEIKLDSDKIYFKGIGGTEKKNYENTLELYKEIDEEKSRYFVRDRVIELILVKKEEGPFWPQLLKQKVKMHWLKVDFTKWKDENDSDEEGGGGNEEDIYSMMQKMGGLGMGGAGGGLGMGGMGGAGGGMDMAGLGGQGKPSLDDLEYDSDEDDDGMPELS